MIFKIEALYMSIPVLNGKERNAREIVIFHYKNN